LLFDGWTVTLSQEINYNGSPIVSGDRKLNTCNSYPRFA
jgi:hypothetical protein